MGETGWAWRALLQRLRTEAEGPEPAGWLRVPEADASLLDVLDPE